MNDPPPGWGGANSDVSLPGSRASGIVVLFRNRDIDKIIGAARRYLGRPSLARLHGAPAIWYAEPYGE